jgi:hypothetical protein
LIKAESGQIFQFFYHNLQTLQSKGQKKGKKIVEASDIIEDFHNKEQMSGKV